MVNTSDQPALRSFELLDDGAHEVVDERPARAAPAVVELCDVVRATPHSKRGALGRPKDGRSDYIQMRGPAGVARLARTHAPLYAVLTRLSLAKRAAGLDGGVSNAELVKEMGAERRSVSTVMESLRQNGVVRTVRIYEGYQGSKTIHYPTEQGSFLFALAEQLGPGVQITTGGSVSSWKGRNQSEPSTVFDFATLLGERDGRSHRERYA